VRFFWRQKYKKNRKATVLPPYGNRVVSVLRPYDAAYDRFTRYDAYGESKEYNSALKATIHRRCAKMSKKSHGNRTIPRRPYGHRANFTIFTSYGARNPQSYHLWL